MDALAQAWFETRFELLFIKARGDGMLFSSLPPVGLTDEREDGGLFGIRF